MSIYAIGDLHLSLAKDKPMSIFGENWKEHEQKIKKNWLEKVKENDYVILLGDFSWATYLEEAYDDFKYLDELPGKKILLKGNHDYWWGSISKVRDMLPCCMYALQNDTVELGSVTIAGSRGWICPGSSGFDPETDQKIYDREVIRLQLSLSGAKQGSRIIVMLHYPPFNEKRAPSGFTEMFEKYGVERVIYGHLHGKACRNAFEGIRNGIEYTLCSADHLDFVPKLITEI